MFSKIHARTFTANTAFRGEPDTAVRLAAIAAAAAVADRAASALAPTRPRDVSGVRRR